MEQLHKVSARSFSIRLGDLGFFDRAGVFFVVVSVTPQLTRLQQAVTMATSDCGFVPEDRRPYHPHITLARRKGQSGSSIRELKRRLEAGTSSTPRFSQFTAQEFLLYESFLGPSGSRYEVRASFPLDGNKGD
jgi:2'-5' RNA ligase